jgi:lipopolysaccharide export system permease protein
MPVACLCATIFVYNRLSYESEILVLKSSGLSSFRIAKPAIILFFMVTLVGYFISLYLMPVSYREFKEKQIFLRDNYAVMLLEEGVFNTPSDGIAVYIASKKDDGTLGGILVHDNRDPAKPVTMMAKSGKIIRTPDSVRFLLQNASRQQINRSNGEVSILYFDSYPFDISFYTQTQTGKRALRKDERFLNELLNPEEGVSQKDKDRFFAEAHERMIWPLYSFALPVLALGILLGGDYSRRGLQPRIIAASVACIVVIFAGFMSKNIITGGRHHLAVLMYLPVIISTLLGLYLLLTESKGRLKNATL